MKIFIYTLYELMQCSGNNYYVIFRLYLIVSFNNVFEQYAFERGKHNKI